MSTKVVCIACPVGCRIEVEGRAVSGYRCLKGKEYAYNEATNPVRIFTGSVRITYGDLPVLSVRSVSGVPKNRMKAIASMMRKIVLHAPIRIGQVVIPDILGTGVDIVATRTIGRIPESRLSGSGKN